jgi:hypothetical protein
LIESLSLRREQHDPSAPPRPLRSRHRLDCVHEGLGLTTNLFAATFYVMVGFHGAHVTVGMLWLLTLWYLLTRGRLAARDEALVDMAGLYWHFVDVVWIAIFTLVYLIQDRDVCRGEARA